MPQFLLDFEVQGLGSTTINVRLSRCPAPFIQQNELFALGLGSPDGEPAEGIPSDAPDSQLN